MNVLVLAISVLLSIFSTGVMSYIAMATPIGPWIAPTLVLVGTMLFSLFRVSNKSESLSLATAAGSIGGILATAFGFSFPTLYFLDPELFNSWMSNPLYFSGILIVLALAAGGYGLLIANALEKHFIVEQKMVFPIGQMIHKMIAAGNQTRKAVELGVGFLGASIISILQGPIFSFRGFVPKSITLLGRKQWWFFKIDPIYLRLDILPMLLAIGFITGHVIALPLIVGALSKIFILDVTNGLFFGHIKSSDFLLAFCSGMIFVGAIRSFFDLPKMARSLFNKKNSGSSSSIAQLNMAKIKESVSIVQLFCVAVIIISFLTYFKFSILEQIYLLVFTFVCTYQIALIAGKIGMAQLGRFATFVMVPVLFLFGIDPVKLTIIATFVEISGGVATDVLFGRKMGALGGIDHKKLQWFQIFGLVVASISVGFIFWTLIHHFGLGADGLFAQRAQARALLINVRNFDLYVLLIGGVYGLLLKKLKMSPMLVLSGLIMPLNYSLGLIAGGLLTFVVADREDWEAFWSGIFAANSIWELVKTVL